MNFASPPLLRKISRWLLRGVVALFGILCIAFALLLVRLAMGPINLDFLVPDVEAELQMPEAGLSASVGHVQLAWRQWHRPFEIELMNVTLQKDENPHWLAIEEVGVSFKIYQLLKGDFALTQIRIYRPHLVFEKNKDGNFFFEFGQESSSQNFSFEILSSLLSSESSSSELEKLRDLKKISIIDADILLKDLEENKTWNLPKATLVLKQGAKNLSADLTLRPAQGSGSLKLGMSHRKGTDRIDSYAKFNKLSFQTLIEKNVLTLGPPNQHEMTIDDIIDFLQQINVPLKGKIHIAFDLKALDILDGSGNIHIGPGEVNLGGTDGSTPPLTSGHLQFSLSPQTLELKKLELTSNHMSIECSGHLNSQKSPLSLSPGDFLGQTFSFQGNAKNIPLAQVSSLWPPSVAPQAREWLTENIHGGMLSEANFTLNGQGGEKGFAVDDLQGTLKGEKAEITYLKGLPPAQNINAIATFTQKGFDITVLSGNIASLPLEEGHIVISNLDTSNESLTLSVKSKGAVSEFLKILNHKPLEYGTKSGINLNSLKGEGSFNLEISFPLLADLRFKDIRLKGEGKLQHIFFDRPITKDLKASLADGNLSLNITENDMKIKGKGNLNNLPASLDYTHYFNDSSPEEVQIKIDTRTTFEDLKRFGFDTQGYAKGLTKASLTYTLGRNQSSQLLVALDTSPSTFSFPPLNWKKPPGVVSDLSFTLNFENKSLSKITNLVLNAPPYSLKGDILFSPQQRLEKILLSEFKGPHTQTHITLYTPHENAYEISFKGQSLNLEDFLKYMDTQDGKKDSPPTTIKVSALVDHLRLGAGKTFQNVKASTDLFLKGQETIWKDVHLRAQAGQGTASKGEMAQVSGGISLDMKESENNTQTLEARANDGGQLLKNMDITNDIFGGYIVIKGQRTNQEPYKGTFKLNNFNANKVPLVTRFAALLSPMGIVNLFSQNQSLSMERFNCQFEYDENRIVIKKGVGKSVSLGFTVEGTIDRKNRLFNLKGNVIPARFLNSLLNNIPLIGSLITGGEGEGLIAVAYTVQGPFDAPDISLNPLSALAPGFIRKLFQTIGDDQ